MINKIFNANCDFGNRKNSGFTLIEMLIAIALFTIIAALAAGAIISVFDAHKRAQFSKTAVDNFNFSLENMARTIRFGNNYYCGISSNRFATRDCSASGSNAISVTFDGTDRIVYRLNGTTIQRSNNGGSSYSNITAPDVVVNRLRFYIFGTGTTDSEQPYVVAVIGGHVGNKPTNQTVFSIQTLMSQRVLDI